MRVLVSLGDCEALNSCLRSSSPFRILVDCPEPSWRSMPVVRNYMSRPSTFRVLRVSLPWFLPIADLKRHVEPHTCTLDQNTLAPVHLT